MALYEYEHSETSTAPAAAIWPLWADTSRWPEWDAGVRSVVIDGPFAVGTSGTMTMDGMPPIELDSRAGTGANARVPAHAAKRP